MAKKNSRDLFKQMNNNVSVLEETVKSPILSTLNANDNKLTDDIALETHDRETLPDSQQEDEKPHNEIKPQKAEANDKFKDKKKKETKEKTEENHEKNGAGLVRITYNLTTDLNEKLNDFIQQYEVYKTSLIKALMEGWLNNTIELDEDEVLFNDGLIKIKKKAGARKAVGSILIPAELDKDFAKKCHEIGIDKNSCIFRLLKKYLSQKIE